MVMSVLTAGLVLAIGWAALLAALHSYLIRSADGAAYESAHALAEQLADGTLPREILSTEQITTTAQVVRDGQVVNATRNALHDPPFVERPQNVGAFETFTMDAVPYDSDGPFRVGALGAKSPRGDVTIYVAVDVEDAYDELGVAAGGGAVAALAILSVLSVLLWIVIGSALRPVSDIRRRADEISGRGLHLRVPVPETEDEISALATTINAMLERVEASARSQDAFVADAAHELRTPLATLRARLEVELLPVDGADAVVLRELLTDVVRMADLVDQLLLLSRNDSSSATFEPVDIDDLVVRAAADFVHPTIKLTVRQDRPVQVWASLTLLEQVLPNLLANAARYARHELAVGVEVVRDRVVIVVDDDGPGIPEADRKRVFERFVRLDDARGRRTGGYGLGLALVARIVNLNKGRVVAEESPLGGARIRIELPIQT